MHIFIDESGSFAGIGAPGVDVIGALVVPDSQLSELESRYAEIRPDCDGEWRSQRSG